MLKNKRSFKMHKSLVGAIYHGDIQSLSVNWDIDFSFKIVM